MINRQKERRNHRIGLVLFLLLLVSFHVSSCQNDNQGQKNHTLLPVVDDLGNEIFLPGEVTRAVSLAPNLTEIVFAVDAGDKLVGVTSFCNYPEGAKRIKKIGDTLKPNIESIIALKPQVVFVSTASQLESFTKTLEEQEIRVFVTNPNSVDQIYESVRKIGRVFGKKEEAASVVGGLRGREKKIELKTNEVGKIRTFVQIDKSLFTIGKDSYLTSLIEKAGGISVTKDVETAYPKISKERALVLNPQAIIISDSTDNNQPNEVFSRSEAVKNGRVYKINADILSRPGPRTIEALERIAESLHPELFGKKTTDRDRNEQTGTRSDLNQQR